MIKNTCLRAIWSGKTPCSSPPTGTSRRRPHVDCLLKQRRTASAYLYQPRKTVKTEKKNGKDVESDEINLSLTGNVQSVISEVREINGQMRDIALTKIPTPIEPGVPIRHQALSRPRPASAECMVRRIQPRQVSATAPPFGKACHLSVGSIRNR